MGHKLKLLFRKKEWGDTLSWSNEQMVMFRKLYIIQTIIFLTDGQVNFYWYAPSDGFKSRAWHIFLQNISYNLQVCLPFCCLLLTKKRIIGLRALWNLKHRVLLDRIFLIAFIVINLGGSLEHPPLPNN